MLSTKRLAVALGVVLPAATAWVTAAGSGNQQATIVDIPPGLRHTDWRVRRAACDMLGDGEDTPQAIVAALQARLKDEDSLVRRAAAQALARCGSPAAPATMDLIQILDQDYVGIAASRALQSIGPQAVESLVKVIHDREERPTLRDAALVVLSDFGPRAKEAVGGLVGLLTDAPLPDETVIRVCEALGAIGSDAASAVPILLRSCQQEDSLVRLQVARALGKISPMPVGQVRSLIEAMQAEQRTLELISTGRLDSRRQPLTSSSSRTVRDMAEDEHRSAYVQMEFVHALMKLQVRLPRKEAESVVMPALMKVLEYRHTPGLAKHWHEGSNPENCPHCLLYIGACRALQFYGPSAESALPVLENLLQYKRPENEVRQTIKAIQPDCYLDPWVLSSADEHAQTRVVVRREEMASDDGRHIIIVLRLRKNTRSREELQRIFPNAVDGWVRMSDEIKWGEPEDQPVAERVAKIPAKRTGDNWWADLTIPRMEHTTLHVWDTKWQDYSGALHELALAWSSPD